MWPCGLQNKGFPEGESKLTRAELPSTMTGKEAFTYADRLVSSAGGEPGTSLKQHQYLLIGNEEWARAHQLSARRRRGDVTQACHIQFGGSGQPL